MMWAQWNQDELRRQAWQWVLFLVAAAIIIGTGGRLAYDLAQGRPASPEQLITIVGTASGLAWDRKPKGITPPDL
jgi:hypothetical protein